MYYEKFKKKRCWGCNSLDTIRWGKQQNKQRYKCNNCGLLFSGQNKQVSKSNRFIWFEKWVVGRRTLHQLSMESGYSESTLKRHISSYLSTPPKLSVFPSEKVNLMIDGTYFRNGICLVLYRDNTIKFTQLYRFSDGEKYAEIKEDLLNLIKLGVQIESVTSDGHRSILKAVKEVLPEVKLQRCLVHIQRDCRVWLTVRPKTTAAIELKKITSVIYKISNHYELGLWLLDLSSWHKKHKDFINQKSYNFDTGRFWYTHKMVRRVFMTIKRALPNMFHYLDNPNIPKTTNSIESFFGHLKGHLNIHRGLSYNHRKQYIMWYLYFKNKSR